MSDTREKRILAKRKKPKKILGFEQQEPPEEEAPKRKILGIEQEDDEKRKKRYEDDIKNFKKDKDEDSKGWVEQLSEYAEPVIKGAGKVVSKVRDTLMDTVHRATTPKWTPDREKVIAEKVKGKKK